jgi:predicted nucleotidyltransferase
VTEPSTQETPFEAMLARLRAASRVHGLVLLGSTAHGNRAPHSDFDLLVIAEGEPVPLLSGTEWVGETMVDLVFASPDELKAAVQRSVDGCPSEADARLARWLASGEVVFDRGVGISSITAQLSAALAWSPPESDLYARWDHDCYNLAHNRRYAYSGDTLYEQAFHLRLTYGLADLMVNYFHARALPWNGEKAALRHWQANDRAYLEEFQACLHAGQSVERFETYERLVNLTWKPYRPPWSTGAVSIVPAGRGLATVGEWDRARAFWEDLVR